jgi:hypothetical protein
LISFKSPHGKDTKQLKLISSPESRQFSKIFFPGKSSEERVCHHQETPRRTHFQSITKSPIGNANSPCFRSIGSRNFAAPAFSTTDDAGDEPETTNAALAAT